MNDHSICIRPHPIPGARRSIARPRAFTIAEFAAILIVLALAIAVLLPLVGAGRSRSRELASLKNLKVLAGAHAAYAADWSDRQFTHMPDELSLTGGVYSTYYQEYGCPPSIVLGYGGTWPPGGSEGEWGYWMPCKYGVNPGNFAVLWPMILGGGPGTAGQDAGFGMFRLNNVVGFNEYVNGRFMDPTFFAPADADAMASVGPGMASEHPFTFLGYAENWFSSYALSPAAMYHPGVFAGDEDGVFKSPYEFELASVSPTNSQCAHPELKSRITEHAWLQGPPSTRLSIDFPYTFNLGADSVPMTLFFDGHTGEMPIRKVLADNDAVVKGGGEKLWMDADITIGPWTEYGGYYSNYSVDDTRTSVHVFTRKGILGRDLLTTGP